MRTQSADAGSGGLRTNGGSNDRNDFRKGRKARSRTARIDRCCGRRGRDGERKPNRRGTAPLTSGVQHLTSYAPKTSEPYEFNYTGDEFYGPVHCVGKHQTNERKGYPGNATEGGRDVERCRSTTGEPLKGMAPGETATDSIEGYSEWGSDWDGNAIVSTNFSYKVSASGKAFKIIAYYPYPG